MRKKGNTSSVSHLGPTPRGEFCVENGKLSTKPGYLSSFLLTEDFQELCLIVRGWLCPQYGLLCEEAQRLKTDSFNLVLGILGGCLSSFLNDGFH